MFREWRVRRLNKKFKKYMTMLENADEYLSRDKQDGIMHESLESSRVRIKNRLNNLTWKYLKLAGVAPEKINARPRQEILDIHDLTEIIGPIVIRHEEGFINVRGLDDESIDALARINEECELGETLMNRLLGEKASTLPRQLIERMVEFGNLPTTEAGVFSGSTNRVRDEIDSISDQVSDELKRLPDVPATETLLHEIEKLHKAISDMKVDINKLRSYIGEAIPKEDITLKDLDLAMRQEIAKNAPGLHGDMALLLHRLRDPVNHPVSLVEMSEDVANGRCEDPGLVASALDMMVEEFRERIGPRRNFETSDKGCLEAMDIERNTVC